MSQKHIKNGKKKKQKKQSEGIDSAGVIAKKKFKNGNVEFICRKCKEIEDIPRAVVEKFDMMDGGDPKDPPRFSCEKCGNEMVPVYFESIHGITYTNSELKKSSTL